MITARQIPRKFIGLARRARAALDEGDALPDGDARQEEFIDIGDDIVDKYFLGLEKSGRRSGRGIRNSRLEMKEAAN
jgi:hypothetical protein